MDTTAIIERLRGSAVWQQAEAEAEAELTEKRRAAAARIRAAEGEFEKTAPGLRKAVDKARATHDRLLLELDEATAALQAAEGNLRNASERVSAVRSRECAYLRQTAPQSVDEFRRELEAEFERARRLSTVTEGGKRNWITGEVSGGSWNRPAISAYAHALLQAIQGAEDLKLIADPDELEKAIEEVRAGLPDPSVMTPIEKWRAA
jgi:hypothetical protein